MVPLEFPSGLAQYALLIMPKHKMNLSPEARQARSDRAKRQWRAGKFGHPAALEKRLREAEHRAEVAERLQRESGTTTASMSLDLLRLNRDRIQNLVTEIFEKGTRAEKVRVTELLMKYGLQSARLGLDERREENKMSREELVAHLSQRLTEGPTALLLRKQFEDGNTINGRAVEVSNSDE